MAKTEAGTTLAEFLRTCRARVSPDDVIPDARRRAPGLRREELVQLAGSLISTVAQ